MSRAKLNYQQVKLGQSQTRIRTSSPNPLVKTSIHSWHLIIMLASKYKKIRKIGRSSSGQTFLVEDQNRVSFALQVRPLKQTPKQLLLDAAAKIQKIDSPYIVKIMDAEADQKNIYVLFQYCNGGNLHQYKSQLHQRVFTMEQATQTLAEVIVALQAVHRNGHAHGRLMGRKIFLSSQNGKQRIKIKVDLPFDEQKWVNRDRLGEQFHYKSPELLSSQNRGFQSDMWALGVLFYFMLNMQYPFQISQYWTLERQVAQLNQLATDFSYSKSIQESQKKILANCTPEIQDLFKSIFEPDLNKRLKFDSIRQHAVFKQHFAGWQKREDYQGRISNQQIKEVEQKPIEEERKAKPLFEEKVKEIEQKKGQIEFLKQISQEFMNCELLNLPEKLMLAYNLKKYYIILLREFKQTLTNDHSYSFACRNNQPQLDRGSFNQGQHPISKSIQTIILDIQEELSESEFEFVNLYRKCQNLLQIITTMNRHFPSGFSREIQDNSLEGDFRQSYRQSTNYAYSKLKQLGRKTRDVNQKKQALQMLIFLIISHTFNHLSVGQLDLEAVFRGYLQETGRAATQIDYRQLKAWIKTGKRDAVAAVGRQIGRICFG